MITDRLKTGFADAGFQLKVLTETGIVSLMRPDRTAKVLSTLLRGGTTPATAARIAAIKHGEKPFIVDEAGSLSFSQVDLRTNALARALNQMGVGGGDGVAIMCRNHRGFIESNLAASKLGATAIFLNTMFSGPQLTDVVRREEPKVLIHDREFTGLLGDLPGGVVRVVADGESQPGEIMVEELIASTDDAVLKFPSEAARFIILTSGTTGAPKGAQRNSPDGLGGLAGLLDCIPHRSGEVMVIAAPLFHSWGFINSVIAMTLGATVVLERRFDPERTMELVEEHSADVLVAVPVMLQRILELPAEISARFQAENLKITTLSGSALPGGLAIRWMDRYGDNVYNLYGSTEVAFVSIAGPENLRKDPATAGRPPRGTAVLLLDDGGSEVADGETGRIFVNNNMTFEGYTGGEDKERIDGFVSSGDVGHFDPDGLLSVDGRDDEMIVSGGENVFPGEVEDLIAGHDDVVEVAVIGVEDEEFGQALKAWVVPVRPEALNEAGIKAFVRQNLASYKTPKEVIFIAELPRNATGKILKRALE
ncbi:MAG: AMP-binding protein [Solirubrobacterales bacterium]